MLKDTRGIIGSLKSKDKQYNGQNKETKNDLQNTTQKTKDIMCVTYTTQKTKDIMFVTNTT